MKKPHDPLAKLKAIVEGSRPAVPGDWTTRGPVVGRSEVHYNGGDPSRVELLREVADALDAGQVVDTLYRTEGGALVIGASYSSANRMTRRRASLAVLATLPAVDAAARRRAS